MMERLIEVEVTTHATIIETLEIVCPMTGFKVRLSVEHRLDGSFRTLELRPG